MKRKPKIKSLGIQVIALLFLANLTGSYYWVKTHTMAAACIDMTTVSTDSRCLYILTGKVFEMGSRNNPHRGHPCGMDVTSILPGNHSANISKYLDPRYRADLCTASVPTNTPKPTNTTVPLATNTPMPTNTPRPTNTSAPQATDTPKPTNTLIPTATITPKPTNTATPKPTIPGSPTNTPTLKPTNTSTPKPTNTATPKPTNKAAPLTTNTPRPTLTVPIVTAVIAIADGCLGVDQNNDGVVNSMDYIACNGGKETPTPPMPTSEPVIISPVPTAGVETEQQPTGFYASLGFAAWWGVVLAMASAGTLASTLLLGVVKAMSTTIADNLATGKFRPAVAPTENNLVINKGDIIDKLFYMTYFGGIDDNSCWVNLSGNEGLILGKLNQPKITEGFYKVTGFTVTTAVNPYIAIDKIVPLEKSG